MQHRALYAAHVAPAPPVLIKKYGNRRLYDTGESRYVTLEELAAKIRAGHDLRVIDAQTSDDLTQSTLTQIVLETGNAAKFLPVQLLTQMIRLSDDALAEFFSRYVTGALDLYLNAKRGVQSLAAYNPLAQLPFTATDALARMWASPFGAPYPPPGYAYVSPADHAHAAAPAVPTHDGDDDDDEETTAEPGAAKPSASARRRDDDVAAMRRELDELKQVIREGLATRTPAPRKKRKP